MSNAYTVLHVYLLTIIISITGAINDHIIPLSSGNQQLYANICKMATCTYVYIRTYTAYGLYSHCVDMHVIIII